MARSRSTKGSKDSSANRDFCDRRKQTLFIDVRKLGSLIYANLGNPSLH